MAAMQPQSSHPRYPFSHLAVPPDTTEQAVREINISILYHAEILFYCLYLSAVSHCFISGFQNSSLLEYQANRSLSGGDP